MCTGNNPTSSNRAMKPLIYKRDFGRQKSCKNTYSNFNIAYKRIESKDKTDSFDQIAHSWKILQFASRIWNIYDYMPDTRK